MRRFFRLSGGGNDFLALVASESDPDAAEIRSLCRRGLSVGADGLFLLDNRSESVAMRYFNADGRAAELCLNGTRCAVRLAEHLGWATGTIEVETGAGVFRGRVTGDSTVELELPAPDAPRATTLRYAGSDYSGWYLDIGVPHFVLPRTSTLANTPVERLGRALRSHPQWGDRGANVDFVRFTGRHRMEIRTFERGVEAETLACGTGVMAAVAAGITTGELELPVSALTLGGFELEVGVGDDRTWTLAGDARLITEGTLHPGALDLPTPPEWS